MSQIPQQAGCNIYSTNLSSDDILSALAEKGGKLKYKYPGIIPQWSFQLAYNPGKY
jgi:hypothetical protein